jgi:cation diffusion facilitator family transporter
MNGAQTENASSDDFNFQKIVLVVGIFLLTIKFIAWWLTDSVSILTDALESIVNVLAAVIGLYALYLSGKPRDAEHPYGHGRAETISSTIEGTMIAAAGIIIIYEAVMRILHPSEIRSLDYGLLLVAFAALVNYLVGTAAIRKGKKNRSQALVASGKHLRSDTLSSVGIIIGLMAMLGLEAIGYNVSWLDGAIALVFGAIITSTGVRVVKESMDTVMDRTDDNLVEQVAETINEHRHDDWIDIHNLRIIKFGTSLHIEMHVILPKNMTVEEQYTEIKEVKESIRDKFGSAVDISFMGEPCSPKMCPMCGRNCSYRSAEFVAAVRWDAKTLSGKKETVRSQSSEDDKL